MYMHKKFYTLSSKSERNDEYKKRITSRHAIKTNLFIKPQDQPDTFRLFYTISSSMTSKMDCIRVNQLQLTRIYDNLPEVAQTRFLIDMIGEELKSSNELEGVESSKKEIVETAKKIIQNHKTKARLSSMIHSYIELFMNKLKEPTDCNDIRKIYDFITKGEISDSDLPDGDLFRKEATYVLKRGSVGSDPIHTGVMPEEKICECLTDLLDYMETDENKIFQIAIGHYYFGYVHPFYDSNGRTSRFISSLYIRKHYDELTAISLSQGCILLREKYLDAFDKTNKISSMGELDYFIDVFLDIIIKGQETVLDNLRNKIELLELTKEIIITDTTMEDNAHDDKKRILFILAQAYHFSQDKVLSLKDLRETIKQSPYITKKLIADLVDKGKVITVKKRPLLYMISPDYLSQSER